MHHIGGGTSEESDTTRPTRASADTAPHNGHSQTFCRGSTARICNGRVPGATSGASTSFGSRAHWRAVVDYWLASAALLHLLPSLAVTGTPMASQLSDHATLPAATQPLPRPDHTPQQGAPPQQRQFHPAEHS